MHLTRLPKNQQISDKEALPSKILSKEEYITQLFALLDISEFADKAWEVLMFLPTHPKFYAKLTQFEEKPSWSSLLPYNSAHTLLYFLQIIYSLIKPTAVSSFTNSVKFNVLIT